MTVTSKDDQEAHEHEWTLDYSQPTLDSNPPHYALECACGATACGNVGAGEIHKVSEAPKNQES